MWYASTADALPLGTVEQCRARGMMEMMISSRLIK